jgi:hypothetical protein
VSAVEALGNGEIDLLIGYTPDALKTVPSRSALLKRIENLVTITNSVFGRSKTGVSIRVVGVIPLPGVRGTNGALLNHATYRDGVWDELLEERDRLGADMITVFVGATDSGLNCGLGWLNGISEDGERFSLSGSTEFMVNLVSINPICNDFTLAHEIGHNLGSDHDRANAFIGPFTDYVGYGHRFTARGQLYRTIMSYAPGWEIPLFSNPALRYGGKRAGISAKNDSASIIRDNAPVVSALRAATAPELTLPRFTEPNRLSVSLSRERLQILTLRSRKKIGSAKVELLYASDGSKSYEMYRGGLTNKRGSLSLRVGSSTGFRRGRYRVCMVKRNGTYLCSSPIRAS